tara:strand:+ start:530 stop:865 length:336 start_codon:yes stop_codon:yes gene_type:complete
MTLNIPHPQKKGKRLEYSSLHGPEHGVYYRGRLRGHDRIELPEVWRDLVEELSITVSITPIGMVQSIIVKGIQNNQVILDSNPGVPIDCYYHVYGERKDVPRLKTEGKVKS